VDKHELKPRVVSEPGAYITVTAASMPEDTRRRIAEALTPHPARPRPGKLARAFWAACHYTLIVLVLTPALMLAGPGLLLLGAGELVEDWLLARRERGGSDT
jgi:hypothetical protein